jgi:anti-sigma factor RsiW
MDRLARLTTDDRENLTAYLDGELDEDATRRIESVLAGSTVARNDVELLAQTYELLDELPRPKAPADFAEKTMATARLEGIRPPLTQRPWFRQAQRGVTLTGWTTAMVASAAMAFAVTNQWIRQPEDEIVEELPVIRNLHMYNEVKSMEFLDRLSADQELLNEIRMGGRP